jgi:hypothetical protein
MFTWWEQYNAGVAQKELAKRDEELVRRITEEEEALEDAELDRSIAEKLKMRPSVLHSASFTAARHNRLQYLVSEREVALKLRQKVEKAKDRLDAQPSLAAAGTALKTGATTARRMLKRIDKVEQGMQAQNEIASKVDEKINQAFIKTERPEEKAVRDEVLEDEQALREEAIRDTLHEASRAAAPPAPLRSAPPSSRPPPAAPRRQ